MARAKIAGAAIRQVSTIAEPPIASNRNDPVTSPTASNASAIVNNAAEPFATPTRRTRLLFRSALTPNIAGKVK